MKGMHVVQPEPGDTGVFKGSPHVSAHIFWQYCLTCCSVSDSGWLTGFHGETQKRWL